MESVMRAGRNVSSGVYRVAGALARGARRVLASVPLLGIAAVPPDVDDAKSTGGEEAETGSATAGSPVEEKSAVSSPTAENEAAPMTAAAPAAETKEEVAASTASSPADEKKEEPTPSAPTPVPVEEKKEEVEKVEAEKKVVEVSPAGGQSIADPVEVCVFRVQPVATPSIIERKTSEDIPSQPPSSPPPTPIDPSPLQQAQQAAATATALAEALKLPAEAADKELAASSTALSSSYQESNDPPKPPTESLDVSSRLPGSSTDEPLAEATLVPAKLEALPVVDKDTACLPVATAESLESSSKSDEKEKLEEVEALPVVDSNAKSLDAPPEVRPPLSETNDPEKREIETSLPVADGEVKESSDGREKSRAVAQSVVVDMVARVLEESCEIKVDEKLEVPCDVVTPEKVNIEEKEPQGKVSDPIEVPSNENKPTSVVAETTVVEEEPRESVDGEKKEGPNTEIVAEQSEESSERIVEETTTVAKEEVAESKSVKEETLIEPSESTPELVLDSEEGPVPVSREILVEAKPAVVIPEADVEETADTNADAAKMDKKSVAVIYEAEEDKAENEVGSEIALPSEEMVISNEAENLSVPDAIAVETRQPTDEPVPAIEKLIDDETNVTEIMAESIPPPVPKSPVPSSREKTDVVDANIEVEPNILPPPTVDTEPSVLEAERIPEVGASLPLAEEEIVEPTESSLPDTSVLPDLPTSTVKVEDASLANESQTNVPTPLESTGPCTDLSECPLPPEELSSPPISSNVSELKSELPVSVENAPSLRNPTETLLTPPRSPSPQSNVSIPSNVTTSTKDCSQTQLCDDQSNREFKMESVSISLNSYKDSSDIELKERLAESPAETENQEESFSCQLSNNAASTGAQEIHQSTPEPEAPVENNTAHETSTTESSDDAPKVAPPAVPTEVPASPPSAPAITEDVASVTKAIEEIDISDKAVAAATIECNTNEIIADAHHQNNINE